MGGGGGMKIRHLYIFIKQPPRSPTQLGEGGLLKRVGPETHVHKITNVPLFCMAHGLNDFYAGKSITKAIGRGGP